MSASAKTRHRNLTPMLGSHPAPWTMWTAELDMTPTGPYVMRQTGQHWDGRGMLKSHKLSGHLVLTSL